MREGYVDLRYTVRRHDRGESSLISGRRNWRILCVVAASHFQVGGCVVMMLRF